MAARLASVAPYLLAAILVVALFVFGKGVAAGPAPSVICESFPITVLEGRVLIYESCQRQMFWRTIPPFPQEI